MSAPVVAVLSPRPGSLTTSIVANVGGLLARAGNRTLLVSPSREPDLAYDLGMDPAGGRRTVTRAVRPSLDVLLLGPASAQELRSAVPGGYDVVLVDASTGDRDQRAAVLRWADQAVVATRPDRAAVQSLRADLDDLRGQRPDLLGVVIAGVPPSPRGILARTRRGVVEALGDDVPVFLASVRANAPAAWSARDQGLLLHELAGRVDRSVLDTDAVDAVLGLARDYVDLAEELVLRLHPEEGGTR